MPGTSVLENKPSKSSESGTLRSKCEENKRSDHEISTLRAVAPTSSNPDIIEVVCPRTDELSSPPAIYTIFSRRQKHLLSAVLALGCLASTLTATTYLPLLPLLQTQYHSSAQAINLTLTFYIIIQSVTPALFAPLSDTLGRRPILLLTFLIYTVATLALALTKHRYTSLLILRGVQALGASASVAIAYGVIADVCVPSARGSMIGPVMSATNLGTCVGPVVGGLIAWRSGGVKWVFWALVVYGVVTFAALGLLLPETSRSMVGNGSAGRENIVGLRNRAVQWIWLGFQWGVEKQDAVQNADKLREGDEVGRTRRLRMPNPLEFLKIMLWKDTSLILWLGGCNYAAWYWIQASIPSIYKYVYGWNELEVGLAYLPGAIGVIVAGILNGKLMDFKYKLTAREAGLSVNKVSGDDLSTFPIVKARTRGLLCFWIVYNMALCGLGWVVQSRVHPSAPLVLQAIVGSVGTFFFFSFNTLLIDTHPDCPGTAAAASSIMRCGLAAAGTAVLHPLVVAIGRGWYFTLLTILVGGGQGAGIWILQRWGKEWGQQRREKQQQNTAT
ncbi:MFS general substrate transporter [Hyaloscypha hepaticicola]|uniref:MFS general substrate transporter n=1 Tax=Hyaloscypha hepaticicola TaxID=2082293 RepID=A0A2J6Q7K0_9HELO|nr:MFS general substrate transporter [Hyaloscypha hepaticicola]